LSAAATASSRCGDHREVDGLRQPGYRRHAGNAANARVLRIHREDIAAEAGGEQVLEQQRADLAGRSEAPISATERGSKSADR
jgi:hypothetical protein